MINVLKCEADCWFSMCLCFLMPFMNLGAVNHLVQYGKTAVHSILLCFLSSTL